MLLFVCYSLLRSGVEAILPLVLVQISDTSFGAFISAIIAPRPREPPPYRCL